jgi:hypothetical protein
VNRQLKSEIFLRFDSQSDAAQALRINDARLSRILRERIRPSKRELASFTRIFGAAKVMALFGGDKVEQHENEPARPAA